LLHYVGLFGIHKHTLQAVARSGGAGGAGILFFSQMGEGEGAYLAEYPAAQVSWRPIFVISHILASLLLWLR